MPVPVPALQQFSVQPGLSAYVTGKQSRLQQEEIARQEQQRRAERLGTAASLAETPEQWARVVDAGREMFPDFDWGQYEDFETGRTLALGEAGPDVGFAAANLDINRQQLSMQERQFQADQAARAAAASAPQARDMREDQNGVLRYLDTGEPVFPGVTAPPAGPEVRPMSAEERATWQIPADDPRVWAMNPTTGEPSVVGGNGTPGMSIEMTPDGGFRFVQGNSTTARRPTEGEANANIFATRMEAASPLIDEFATSGQNLLSRMVGGLGVVGNIALQQLDPEYQQFAQAARDFINASLRRESGAVISPVEFDNARQQYLPMPGDTEATLAQKAENRQRQIEGIRAASGPFATPTTTTTPPPPAPATADGFDLAPTPEGVDPALWQFMTPEERALWR
jgi:hypothetical protein